jgi:mono/diheme cytochrome c family protein
MIVRMRSVAVLSAALAVLSFTAVVRAAEEASPLDAAKALFEKSCAGCHPLDRALVKSADRAGWKATMDKMIANGAKLDAQQADQIVGYLSAKSAFETKCNGCHDLAKPLAAIKNPEQWRSTVAAMSAKKPGLLSDADAGAIVLYLSLAKPAK